MRFVSVRSLEKKATLMRDKTREMLVLQRTQLLNGLRGHLTEVGVIAAQGPRHARELAELIEACDEIISVEVCEVLAPLVVQIAPPRRSARLARSQQRKARAEGGNGAPANEHSRLGAFSARLRRSLFSRRLVAVDSDKGGGGGYARRALQS